MPYEVQTDSILAGGLNLLSPGERGGETDALALHNWRVDQGGQLRSRLGAGTPILTVPPGSYIHSIGRVQKTVPVRYFGVDAALYRNGASVATGFDGRQLSFVSFQNKCWVMNRSKQVKDDGTNVYNWTPTKPAAAPTGAGSGAGTGSLNGFYDYYVTFVASDGSETNPSPVVTAGAFTNDEYTITRPASTDAQITGWNVYRAGGNFPSQIYRVNNDTGVIPIGTTTYLDNGQDNTGTGGDDQTDDGIAAAGEIMEITHDPAPAARIAAGPYFGRILALGTAAHPNRLFWAETNQPQFFPGSSTDAGGNWADIGEQGEEFIGCAIFPQVALIIKQASVWRLVGDPGDAGSEVERLNISVGGMGIKSYAVAGSVVYIEAAEGIYRISVSSITMVSPALLPIFRGDEVEGYGAIPDASLNQDLTVRSRNCMAYVNGRLYHSVATGSNLYPNVTLVWNEATGQWGTDNRGFTALFYEGQGGSLLGATAYYAYPIEEGIQDLNGDVIAPVFQTRFRNQGQPSVQKHYANLQIQHRLNGATYRVYAIFDNDGGTTALLGKITSGGESVWDTLGIPDFNHGEEPRSIAIRLELDSQGSSYSEILTMALRWYAAPLDGLVFDSGNVKLADGAVCLLQNLEIDIENTGTGSVTYEWQSDLPGNKVQGRATGTISDTGIGSFRASLESVKEARWARLLVRCTAAGCRVRGARVQVRPIGLYLQGEGDDHRTAELNAGSPRLKLFSGIRVESQPDGEILLDFLTDVPAPETGTALTVAAEATIPATTDRQWYEKRLPSTTRGRLYRLTLTSAAAARIFSMLVRCKVLGESPSAWQWVPVPLTPTPDEWVWRELPLQ
jgi:hypothetical protein